MQLKKMAGKVNKVVKNYKILWVVIAILLLIIGILFFSLTKSRFAVIEDFKSCTAAENTVGESYPRQCWAKDGRHFVEEIDDEERVACTMEAKECPDGSFVGRVAPDCEFAPCP